MTRAIVTLMALGLAATAAPRAQSADPGRGQIIQRVLLKVNGEILTLTELEQRQIEALSERNRRVRLDDLQNDATLRAAVAEVTPDILVDAVEELLLVQRGRELGIKLTNDRFKSALEGIKKENKLDDAGLKAALAQSGMTMEDLREQLERTLIIQTIQQQEIMQGMSLTEEEARQYYQAHPEEFMSDETVMLREIFVAVPVETRDNQSVFAVSSDESARAKMQAARDRLAKGEAFAQVAADLSESASKANGGLIGPVTVKDIAPALQDVIAALKPGDTTDPIRTARGYQLLRLESRSPREVEAFDKVRQLIAQKIYQERLEGETDKYLDDLRAQAIIEWKDPALKQMYEKRMSEIRAKGGR